MLNRWRTPSNYKLAYEKVRKAREDYEKTLKDFTTILTGINTGLIHGRKEQSLINKIKPTIALLNGKNLAVVKAEYEYNQLRKNGVILK